MDNVDEKNNEEKENIPNCPAMSSKYYSAINYGSYEGWDLNPHATIQEAFKYCKNCCLEWKILKEIEVIVKKKRR